MKRKLFTLLLAMVAVVAFQAKAQTGPIASVNYWIKADTTGLAENTLPTPQSDFYPVPKVGLDNWLTVVGNAVAVHTAVDNAGVATGGIYGDPNNKFKVSIVGTNKKRFNIKGVDGTVFTQEWLGQSNTQFELVQFNPRTAQEFATLAPNTEVEGYLAIPQGDGVDSSFNSELLLVGYNVNTGEIFPKKFSDWANYTATHNVSPFVSPQFGNAKTVGKLYVTEFPYFVESYSRLGTGLIDSITTILGTPVTGGDPRNYNAPSTVYYFNDFDLTPEGRISANGVDTTLTGIFDYLYAIGGGYHALWRLAIDSTATSPYFASDADGYKYDTLNLPAHVLYIVSKGGKLEVTANNSGISPLSDDDFTDATKWTNGVPQQFGGYYYFFDPSTTLAYNILQDVLLIEQYIFNGDPLLLTSPPGADKYYYKTNSDWRPLYVKITPSCEPGEYEYVTKQWLGEEKLDIAAVNQKVYGTTYHLDKSGAIVLTPNESEAAGLLFEYAGLIDPTTDRLISVNTTPALSTFPATPFTWANDTVELFYIKQGDKYLTVLDNSEFTDLTTTFTVNGLQIGWQNKKNAPVAGERYDDRALQLFAVIKDNTKQEYILTFLPLASYKWVPKTGLLQLWNSEPILYYNEKLGTQTANACLDNFIDLQEVWYVSQYSKTGGLQKLVVADPLRGGNDIVWIELTKNLNFYKFNCETFAVVDRNKRSGAKIDYYYTLEDTIRIATDATIKAHWSVDSVFVGGEFTDKFKFVPELDSLYNDRKPSLNPLPRINLLGEYIILQLENGDVEIISGGVSPYQRDTVAIKCLGHTSPYLDITDFVGNKKVAILESLYQDRNITYLSPRTNDTVYRNGRDQIEAFIKRVDIGVEATYNWSTVYKSTERYLGKNETHLVPYFVFSIEDNNGDKFFLSADKGLNNDSLYWVKLSALEIDSLLNYEKNPWSFPTYKFCLPYIDGIDYNATKDKFVKPVYLQTLEVALDGTLIMPFPSYSLVKAGAETGQLNTVGINSTSNNIFLPATTYLPFDGIYSLIENYTNLKPISSWLLVSDDVIGNDWVRVGSAVDAATKESKGVLTSVDNIAPGTTFVAPSYPFTEAGEANYGILTDVNRNIDLTLEFKGESQIGYDQKPIWYYRIKSVEPSTLTSSYLTDAVDSTKAPYIYDYSYAPGLPSVSFKYGYFETQPAAPDLSYAPIEADADFRQTFGLKYVGDPSNVNFVVVSGANFTKNTGNFRYLGSVRERLVFVNRIEDALTLQWGTVNSNNVYTDIEAVAATNLYGVVGGIKVVNATGKVDVYSIDGRLISSSNITSAETTIAVPAGIYVVKNGVKAVKVVVK